MNFYLFILYTGVVHNYFTVPGTTTYYLSGRTADENTLAFIERLHERLEEIENIK